MVLSISHFDSYKIELVPKTHLCKLLRLNKIDLLIGSGPKTFPRRGELRYQF